MPEPHQEGALQVVAVSERAGDLGLDRIFQEHQGRVFKAAYRITGNPQDAEDVLQTVFLRLVRHEVADLPVDNLGSYLYRAAVNAALDVLRARRAAGAVDVEEADDDAGRRADASPETPQRAYELHEVRDWLRRALARLPSRAAEVFALRYLEDYDNHEIARMLGLSRVTVAVTLHRARHRLQKEFRTRGRKTARGKP